MGFGEKFIQIRNFCDKFAIIDWIVVIIVLSIGLYIDFSSFSPDFQPYVTSDIGQPLRTSTVPYDYLCIVTFGVGGFVAAFIWLIYTNFKEISQLSKILSSYYFTICFTILVTCVMKKAVARPRPDTIARCGGLGTFEDCKQTFSNPTDQFFSFPSGHAAESMAPAVFLSLLLSEIFSSSSNSSSSYSSCLASLIKFMPILFAIIVGGSRVWDRAHHIDDVIMGMFVGALIGYVTFTTFAVGIARKENKSYMTESSASSISFRGYV